MASESRLRALDAILDAPGISLVELSEATDLHVNTLRDHVRVLEAHGLIVSEVEHRATRGRPRTVYSAVVDARRSKVAQARIDAARAHGDLLRRIAPSDVPDGLDVSAQHQVDVLYEHLDDAGLEPVVDEGSLSFEMAPCRYHDMIDEDRALVCGVHARLVQDVLAQTDGPLQVRRLLPFVTAHRCRLELTRSDLAGPDALDDPL